jgi:cytosine/adenosine deaminase-related metal-dependent hydrolase
MPVRTLYSAQWVLPVAEEPIADGAVLVDVRGRIEAVGPAAAFDGFTGARLALGEAALLPGLVNVHAHPELTAFRALLEDLTFPDWILKLMRTRRTASPEPADWHAAARWGCIEAMAVGITTTGATEDSGASLGALLETGLRGVVYREVFGPDPTDAETSLEQLRGRVDAMRTRANSRVRVGISPHAPYTVSDRLFELAADYARAEALPMAVHAAEAAVEDDLVSHGTGTFAEGLRRRGIATPPRANGTIALLERTGVLAVRPLLIHCVRLRADDPARIRDAGASVAHCPTANARLAHGAAPLEALLAADVRVGLGTDSVASNNRLDLLEEARFAQLLVRARTERPGALSARRLLELATIDGARALGIDGDVGTLERGKLADLCAVRLNTPHAQPVHDIAAAVVHAARGSDVVLTVVDGRAVYRAGEFITVDVAAAHAELTTFAAKLARAAASLDRRTANV